MTKPEYYPWPKPEVMAKRLEQLLEAIDLAGYGGSGKEAQLITYSRIWAWYDRLYHFEYCDISEEPEAYDYVHNVCLLDRYLPSYIWRPIRLQDVGYRTFLYVACNYKVFWLCEDCRAPLIYEERSQGCPFCGDNFPQNKRRRIQLS